MSKSQNKNHGGYRVGSGRPKTPDELKKVPFNTRLPYWLILWLREQDNSQSELIETALVKHYKIGS